MLARVGNTLIVTNPTSRTSPPPYPCSALFTIIFFFSSRRRHTRLQGDWSSDVCSSDLEATAGAVLATQPVLADDRVRFQGEPVAAIAATTPEIAAAAADLVEVEYEDLPGVYDPIAALEPDAPRVHDSGNLLRSWHLRCGDVAQGFARADVVVENTYRTPFVDHVYMETESGIGWIDGEGVLTLRVSTQVLEHFRDVAEVLQIPHGRVRIEGAYLGGGFGGKEDVTVECLLGLLVWKTGRPVQLIFSREESFIGHGKRHPYVMRYRTGAARDGTLV